MKSNIFFTYFAGLQAEDGRRREHLDQEGLQVGGEGEEHDGGERGFERHFEATRRTSRKRQTFQGEQQKRRQNFINSLQET